MTLAIKPPVVTPPGQATLTLTDTHTGATLTPGVWYTTTITGTRGGVTQTTNVELLVGGARVYLPLVFRN
jgi:hypothetical protein